MHLVFFLAICGEEQMSHQYFWFKSRYPAQRTCICLLYNRLMDAGGRQKANFQNTDVRDGNFSGVQGDDLWVAFSLCVDSFAASKIQVIFEVEEESKGTSTTYLSLQTACPNFLEVLGLSLSKNSNPGVLFASLLIHCRRGTSKQGKK